MVAYTYDDAGRPGSLAGQPAGGSATNYASSMIYHPHGAVEQMLLGNNKLEQSCYNSRLQPVGMRLSSGTSPSTDCANSSDLLNLAFGYGTSNNNGNVLSQTITMPKLASGSLELTQSYAYDGVNRLASVGETVTEGGPVGGGGAWSQSYEYDPYGNRAATGSFLGPGTPSTLSAFDSATNRLENEAPNDWADYDNAGNLAHFKFPGNSAWDWTVAYDAENRQRYFCANKSVACGSGNFTAEYHYDGEGRRVKRVLGGQTTVYVYDAFGMLAAEYSTATPTETGGRRYRTSDHLGSTRLVTDQSGAVKTRHDYVPFGEELPASSSAGNRNLVFGFGVSSSERQKFTGKERDVESGLDYFGARYLSSAQGRFTSADAPFVDQFAGDPQSWNLYSYVLNNPLVFVDPTGQKCVSTDDGTPFDDGSEGPGCTDEQLAPDEVNIYAYPQLDPLVAQSLRSAGYRAERDFRTFAITSVAAGTAVGGGLALSTPAQLATLGIAGGPAAALIPKLPDILRSAERLARAGAQTTRALQALQKKVDNPLKSTAFNGLPKTNTQAKAIIEHVYGSTSQVVRQGVNRAGQTYVDIYDKATGWGIRVLKNGEFDTFVNLR